MRICVMGSREIAPQPAYSRRVAGAAGAGIFLGVALSLLGPSSAEGQVLRDTEFKAPRGTVNQLAFSPDGKTLASVGSDSDHPGARAYVRLWDVKTGKENAKFPLQTRSSGYLLVFTPDGKTLVSSCGGSSPPPAWEPFKYIEVWDVKTGKRRLLIKLKPARRGRGGAICPDGKTLVLTAPDASAALYDLETGKELAVLAGHNNANVLALSRDGKWLATGCAKGKLGIWDLPKRKLVHLFDAQKGGVATLAISPDGKQIATSGGRSERVLNLWGRAGGGREARLNYTHRFGQIHALRYTPDGKALVFAGDGRDEGICWWELAGGRLRGAADLPPAGKGSQHRCAALSPDGKVLATVNNTTIQLWELREKPKKP